MTATQKQNTAYSLKYWLRNYTSWFYAFLLCVVFTIISLHFLYIKALNDLISNTKQDVNHQLELQVQLLENHLEKFRLLPVLMGQHGNVKQFTTASTIEEIHLWLKQLNYLSGAFDTLILNSDGTIKASAREYDQPNYNASELQTLSQAPAQARLGRQYLHINQNRSLYGFSSAVKFNSDEAYSLAILVDLDPVLQSWAVATAQLTAIDKNNNIVMASDASLIGNTLMSRDELNVKTGYVASSVNINTLGWLVSAQAQVNSVPIRKLTIAASILILIMTVFLFIVLIRRREKSIFNKAQHKRYAQELAEKVAIRTSELNQSNVLLMQEVHDRRIAEAELKTTQQELIHSAKLAAIGQMSTTLSHEYNQPLATMRTYAENGIKFLSLNKLENVEDNLDRIIQQTDRLGKLSQMLMSFSRKPSEQLSNINIYACVEEAFMLVRPRLKSMRTTLRHNIPESAIAYGNSVQISQVILNLLANSIDAINENSSANLENQVLVSYQDNKHSITLSVEDNGPGISESDKAYIFEPFYTSKKANAGLGLGLSIVKDIIKMHKGNLIVTQSKLGGACIRIELPKILYGNEQL